MEINSFNMRFFVKKPKQIRDFVDCLLWGEAKLHPTGLLRQTMGRSGCHCNMPLVRLAEC